MATKSLCAVEACGKAVYRDKKFCQGHWRRWQRHGDVKADVPLGQWKPKAPAREWMEQHKSYSGNECLLWPFKRCRGGYAQISEGNTTRIASRIMCEIVNGPPPSQAHQAAHSCGGGYRGCMNPKHLRWALITDNYADRRVHGTDDVGERNPRVILTADDVRFIRKSKGAISQSILAKKFNVSRGAIAMAQRGVNWAHVDG